MVTLAKFKIKNVKKNMKPSMYSSDRGTTFDVGDGIKITARYGDARDGFNHFAEVYKDGNLVGSAKVHYINRTWESYNYESAISKALDKAGFSDDERYKIKDTAKKLALGKVDDEFKAISNIAKLGEVFGKDQKEKNDWKARMLKAGLGGKGFEMPEDWDTLSEDEKEKRLNKVIEFAGGKK
jgi:hypothetical protein